MRTETKRHNVGGEGGEDKLLSWTDRKGGRAVQLMCVRQRSAHDSFPTLVRELRDLTWFT